jgi:short-subunit dehydrogenase involved in D-alanine esterification of teichoic acids
LPSTPIVHKQQVHSTTFLPLLKNGAVKKVLTVSSGLGDLELTLAGELAIKPFYSISKAALNIVVVKCAAQYKAEGSIFLGISPGIVDTSATSASARQSLSFSSMLHFNYKITRSHRRSA